MSNSYYETLIHQRTVLSSLLEHWNIYRKELKDCIMEIEMKINVYEIDQRFKLYSKFLDKIPIELISHIADFGDNIVDGCSITMLEQSIYK